MSYETIDTIYRGRLTLLEHLKTQGYDITPYSKFSPKEIEEMLKVSNNATIAPALQMDLKREVDDPENEVNTCIVMYSLGRIKQKLTGPTSVLAKLADTKTTGWSLKNTEFIMITFEPIAPNFHLAAAEAWSSKKMRIRFFQADELIVNPLKHVLVPKHEKVPKEQHEQLLKEKYIEKKSQLLLIRFHEDPIARWHGFLPDDIIKITRPSPTAGEYDVYRLCVV